MSATVSLLPEELRDTKSSIDTHLSRFLLKYTTAIGGILLAFDNVKASRNGQIVNELPHVHYSVAFHALVFAPARGGQLRGRVTEVFPSHVSMVVHQYFNASVSSEKLRDVGFEYDCEEWANEESGQAIFKDCNLTFNVDAIHESGGIISIEGIYPQLYEQE